MAISPHVPVSWRTLPFYFLHPAMPSMQRGGKCLKACGDDRRVAWRARGEEINARIIINEGLISRTPHVCRQRNPGRSNHVERNDIIKSSCRLISLILAKIIEKNLLRQGEALSCRTPPCMKKESEALTAQISSAAFGKFGDARPYYE